MNQIPSPCRFICKYGPDKICIGCFRSMDEIIGWVDYTPAEKAAVMERIEKRKSAQKGSANDYDYYV